MRITIITEAGDLHPLEIDSQMELENVKALIEAEIGTSSNDQILVYHGSELTDPKKTLEQYKIVEDEILLLKKRDTSVQQTSSNDPLEPETVRQMILNQPQMMEQLLQTQPELANAARNDPERFAALLQQMQQRRNEAETQRMQQIAMLNADPMSIEAQRLIEEEIRRENVESSFDMAWEYNPELFGRVVMLYINVEVNGYPIKAFVDSGAETTIMSHSCAEKCGVMRLLDTKFSGIAQGVGTAKILGRVHNATLRVGKGMFLPCSLTILEEYGVELLFGLDMLKRHQAIIDLKKNALVINEEVIPFLPEHEIPKKNEIGRGLNRN